MERIVENMTKAAGREKEKNELVSLEIMEDIFDIACSDVLG